MLLEWLSNDIVTLLIYTYVTLLRCYAVTLLRCYAVTLLRCYAVTMLRVPPLLCCYSVTALRCDVYIRGELDAHVSSFEYKEYKEKEEHRDVTPSRFSTSSPHWWVPEADDGYCGSQIKGKQRHWAAGHLPVYNCWCKLLHRQKNQTTSDCSGPGGQQLVLEN